MTPKPEPGAAAAPKTILLVDDDADFVEINRAILETNGFRVIAAYNPKECLEKAQAAKPDLIVLDVMMTTPTDGFQLTHTIRGDAALKKVPILMVTSVNAQNPYRFEPDETWLPVDGFLEKPVAPETLLAEVRQRLGGKKKKAKKT